MKKTVARITFPGTTYSAEKKYNFQTSILDLEKGDKVVVDTVNGLVIAEFDSYDELGFGESGVKVPSKWVVQKIDVTAHNTRVEAAAKVIKIKAMMEARRKKSEEITVYAILAQEDPEMKALLDEYNLVNGEL